MSTERTRTCGRMGCANDAAALVKHPRAGRVVTCEEHAEDGEVVE